MLKKRIIIVIAVLVAFGLLYGVAILLVNHGFLIAIGKNTLTEEQVISYIQNEIYKETGDSVDVNITSKEPVPVCVATWNSCYGYENAIGAYRYKVEIINKDDESIVGTGIYGDGYKRYDVIFNEVKIESKEYAASFTNDYSEQRAIGLLKNELIDLLEQNFDTYYIYNDVSNDDGYDIFVCSSDYDKLNTLLENFRNIMAKYDDIISPVVSIYIYKEEDVFNSTDFDLYQNIYVNYSGQSYGWSMVEQYTGEEVTIIGRSSAFDYELFISNGESAAETYDGYVDYTTFKYLVFWYAEYANSNNGTMHIYGVG